MKDAKTLFKLIGSRIRMAKRYGEQLNPPYPVSEMKKDMSRIICLYSITPETADRISLFYGLR